MDKARKSLMTVTGEKGAPSFEAAARQLGVRPDALDRDFGIVPIDPAADTYAVLVEAPRDASDEHAFSNPRIEPLRR
jgi:hypothetical protein